MEILLVIGILGVVMATAMVGLNTAGDRAIRKREVHRVEVQLERLKLVIEDYKFRFGTYPPENPAIYDAGLYNELRGNGILNKPGSSNPARQAKDYLPNLKADESALMDPTNPASPRCLVAVPAPPGSPPNAPNFWNYNSSNPKNKLAGYDLWAEYTERGTSKSIIISNEK